MASMNSRDLPDFENRGAEELVIDGPPDNTVRPCRPELLKLLQAERDRLAQWRPGDTGLDAPSA
jgi:hypothetical protein